MPPIETPELTLKGLKPKILDGEFSKTQMIIIAVAATCITAVIPMIMRRQTKPKVYSGRIKA